MFLTIKYFCKWAFELKTKIFAINCLHGISIPSNEQRNTESMVNTFLKEANIKLCHSEKKKQKSRCKRLDNWDFSENARDYAIGGTALSLNAKLITNNKKHFKWMNAITPKESLNQQNKGLKIWLTDKPISSNCSPMIMGSKVCKE